MPRPVFQRLRTKPDHTLSKTSADVTTMHWAILDSGSGPEEHGKRKMWTST